MEIQCSWTVGNVVGNVKHSHVIMPNISWGEFHLLHQEICNAQLLNNFGIQLLTKNTCSLLAKLGESLVSSKRQTKL